jgi:hypothetical protein
MHWLLRDKDTPAALEEACFAYDSTVGYNETVGYRAGTTQVFRPLGARTLLELPMHIQDGALFYPQRLNLTERGARQRCRILIENTRKFAGVLTVLWHDRSHAAERFWGDFYKWLVRTLKSMNMWFATGAQATDWFRQRRRVRFEAVQTPAGARVRLRHEGEEVQPPLCVKVYGAVNRAGAEHTDFPWDGNSEIELELPSGIASSSLS